MKGDNNIIVYFNRLLSDELRAANQFFLHAQIFKSFGLKRLFNIEYKESMDELNHASLYMKRIAYLKGVPNIKYVGELNIKKDIEDILRMDLNIEYHSINNLKESIQYADSIQDYISREMMIEILRDEEEHVDFLEVELNIMEKIGIENYIQLQVKE